MNVHTTPRKSKSICVCAAGVGERNPCDCACQERILGRSAIRAIFDGNGRWLVHWREKDGEEWVGTYRLIPC